MLEVCHAYVAAPKGLAGRAPGRSPPHQLRLRAGIKAGEKVA
jgi:hypothetical protein